MARKQIRLLRDMALECATWPWAIPEDVAAEVLADVEKFQLKLAKLTSFLDTGQAAPPIDARETNSWFHALEAQIKS